MPTETQRVVLTADLTRADGAGRCAGPGWEGGEGCGRRFVKSSSVSSVRLPGSGKKERSVPTHFMGRISPLESTSGPEPGSPAQRAGERKHLLDPVPFLQLRD